MDYKYIEQLLERYWTGETTLKEEVILQDFFAQDVLPEHLKHYAPLFAFELEEKEIQLGEDFDKRFEGLIQDVQVVKAQRNNFYFRLRPFYKAAAAVAIVFCLGIVAQRFFASFNEPTTETFNYASYKDTFTDSQAAYEQLASALKDMASGLRESGLQIDADTISRDELEKIKE